KFFSSESSAEAILQKSFAAELLGKTAKPGSDDVPVAELAKPLLGREMTMRYAERTPSATTESAPKARLVPESDGLADATTYSIASRELKLKIVGVTDLDPDSMRGPVRARVLLPLKLVESLHVVQPNALRDTTQASSK